MGLKQRLGTALHGALEATLASKHFPLTRYVPYGLSWLYDLQRFRGTRALGAVFDVGANTGQTLKALLRYAPEADIHSFEPTDGAFAALQAKYTGRANVRLHKMALGSRAETLELQVRADSELNTLVAAAAEAGEGSRTQTTEVATVDDVVAANGISHLDLLKLDVQGWEMEVVRGAARLIADHNLLFVLAEMTFRSDQREMQQFTELHDHLEARGFVLSGLYELLRYGPRKEFVLFANVLYLHPQARLKWSPEMAREWNDWMAIQDPRAGH
jgi:FkbM family methyltransferase